MRIFEIPKKIARIRQQDYLHDQWKNLYNNNNFPIDAIISPEQEPSETNPQNPLNAEESNRGLDIKSVEREENHTSNEISNSTIKETDI